METDPEEAKQLAIPAVRYTRARSPLAATFVLRCYVCFSVAQDIGSKFLKFGKKGMLWVRFM
jgi:hypothetical protein